MQISKPLVIKPMVTGHATQNNLMTNGFMTNTTNFSLQHLSPGFYQHPPTCSVQCMIY